MNILKLEGVLLLDDYHGVNEITIKSIAAK